MKKDVVNYIDFEKIEIRAGRVVEASSPEWSEKLLEFKVDFGPELGTRTIFSGIKKWYNPQYFQNKMYIFVVNLAEKKMGNGVSQGMMLMVDDPLKPYPIEITDPVKEGSEVR